MHMFVQNECGDLGLLLCFDEREECSTLSRVNVWLRECQSASDYVCPLEFFWERLTGNQLCSGV